ncbi:MAG: hypothetical protein KAJ13_03830 [Gemmatimonadetes bacterium]|nr:hypothetical protein [Gemmatimonadota bacterium]
MKSFYRKRSAYRLARPGLLALACLAVLSSCGSSPVEPIPDSLFGAWEWVRAEGGIAGVTITPESEGFTMTLRITRPDRIEWSRNGELEVATRFELLPASGTDFPFPPRLRYDEPILGQEEQELRLSEDELVLTDPCCDGFAYTWVPRLE